MGRYNFCKTSVYKYILLQILKYFALIYVSIGDYWSSRLKDRFFPCKYVSKYSCSSS